jgi:hypothetical protein
MIRASLIAVALTLIAVNALAAAPDACALLTAKDASALAGQPLTAAPNSGGINCRYYGAGGPGVLGVEIAVKVESDPAAAHADFPRWVVPFPGSAGPTVTNLPHLGDEAAIVHGPVSSGVHFRRGAVLVKIGVHPPGAADAALQAAAAAVLGRL